MPNSSLDELSGLGLGQTLASGLPGNVASGSVASSAWWVRWATGLTDSASWSIGTVGATGGLSACSVA